MTYFKNNKFDLLDSPRGSIDGLSDIGDPLPHQDEEEKKAYE